MCVSRGCREGRTGLPVVMPNILGRFRSFASLFVCLLCFSAARYTIGTGGPSRTEAAGSPKPRPPALATPPGAGSPSPMRQAETHSSFVGGYLVSGSSLLLRTACGLPSSSSPRPRRYCGRQPLPALQHSEAGLSLPPAARDWTGVSPGVALLRSHVVRDYACLLALFAIPKQVPGHLMLTQAKHEHLSRRAISQSRGNTREGKEEKKKASCYRRQR